MKFKTLLTIALAAGIAVSFSANATGKKGDGHKGGSNIHNVNYNKAYGGRANARATGIGIGVGVGGKGGKGGAGGTGYGGTGYGGSSTASSYNGGNDTSVNVNTGSDFGDIPWYGWGTNASPAGSNTTAAAIKYFSFTFPFIGGGATVPLDDDFTQAHIAIAVGAASGDPELVRLGQESMKQEIRDDLGYTTRRPTSRSYAAVAAPAADRVGLDNDQYRALQYKGQSMTVVGQTYVQAVAECRKVSDSQYGPCMNSAKKLR